jgi:altronate hydrolase
MVARTAEGTFTKSEALFHREFFIPYKYQEKQAAVIKSCQKTAQEE